MGLKTIPAVQGSMIYLLPAYVGLDAGVGVEMSLHMGVNVELFGADLAAVFHITRVLSLMLLQMMAFLVLFATSGKLTGIDHLGFWSAAVRIGVGGVLDGVPLPLFPELGAVTFVMVSQQFGLGESSVADLAEVRLLGLVDSPEMPDEVVDPGDDEAAVRLRAGDPLLGQVVQLDVSNDERGFDVLVALGTDGVVAHRVDPHPVQLEEALLLVLVPVPVPGVGPVPLKKEDFYPIVPSDLTLPNPSLIRSAGF